MDSKLIAHIQSLAAGKKDFPQIRTGMQVEVSQRITEGDKSRIQKFEGVVIKTGGKTHGEKTFPVACPTVEGVKVIRQYKVNRKHIGYIRDLEGKSARLKEVKTVKAVAKKPSNKKEEAAAE